MRDKSWNSQVQTFGAAVQRGMEERLAQQEVIDKIRGGVKRRVFNYELILAAMEPFRAYTWTELSELSRLPLEKFKSALSTAISNRRIDRTLDRDGSVYSLPIR